MLVKSRIAISVDGRLDIKDPGLLRPEFAEARCCTFDEARGDFSMYGSATSRQSDDVWKSVRDLKRVLLEAHGLVPTRALVEYDTLYFFLDGLLYQLDDDLTQQDFLKDLESCPRQRF